MVQVHHSDVEVSTCHVIKLLRVGSNDLHFFLLYLSPPPLPTQHIETAAAVTMAAALATPAMAVALATAVGSRVSSPGSFFLLN